MQENPVGLVRGGTITDFTKLVAGPLHLGNRVTSAILVCRHLGLPEAEVKSDATANLVLQSYLQFLLDGNRYIDAATLLWSPSLFSGEPRSVSMIWDAMFKNTMVMIPGAASMGKSYSLGVWVMLDWLRDPMYTNVKVVGPSENHLEQNLFSHLVKLYRNASLPLPGEIRRLEIGCDNKEKSSGIYGVVVPIGPRAAGRLQGVKVLARPTVHPQFGPVSRVRVILEEAELIPVGIHEDLNNTLANASGMEQFKVAAPFNPKDPNSPCANKCEPIDGWDSVDVETSEEWMSKRGWKVVRLDGHKSENVVEGVQRFFGMQTKGGLEKITMNSGGVGTAGWYTMARGWYPPQGVDLAVIPQHLVTDLYGTFEFTDTPRAIGSCDVALEGGDNAIFALGRIGTARGWRKPSVDSKPGEFVPFLDDKGNRVQREAVQLDQLFTLPKGDTLKLVAEIKRVCQNSYVKGDLLGIDRTGNGAGVHDLLVAQFSHATHGINGSSSPTEKKILEEDTALPCDEYAYLVSELWFATKKFIEFGFLKISPLVPRDPIVSELTGRKFLLTQKKIKVESKKDYKSRGNRSPDRADALTILIHVARKAMKGPPSATSGSVRDEDERPYEARIGATDRQDYL